MKLVSYTKNRKVANGIIALSTIIFRYLLCNIACGTLESNVEEIVNTSKVPMIIFKCVPLIFAKVNPVCNIHYQ